MIGKWQYVNRILQYLNCIQLFDYLLFYPTVPLNDSIDDGSDECFDEYFDLGTGHSHDTN